MKQAGRPARTGIAVLLFLALVTTSCSGDDDSDSGSPEPQSTASGSAFDIKTEATVEEVAGRLSRPDRRRLAQSVTKVAQRWFNAAYVGGDYPRNDFADAWPGFTSGAQAEAQGDKALMSNQDIGADIAGVEATARKVTVDVLAVKGKPSGATARFVLKFRTDGDVQRKVEVRGRLFLTPEADGWHIFGYDVTKGRWA